MGSFNTTCAISHAPIIEGQKVKLLFIIGTGSYKGFLSGSGCYPWDAFTLVGFPLDAEYCDYGRYDVDITIAATLTMAIFKHEYRHNNSKDADYNTVPTNELTFTSMQESIRRGELKGTARDSLYPVNIMAIHESVYNAFVVPVLPAVDYDENGKFLQSQSLSQLDYAPWFRNKLFPDVNQSKITEMIDRIHKTDGIDLPPEKIEESRTLFTQLFSHRMYSEEKPQLMWSITGISDIYGVENQVVISELMTEVIFLQESLMLSNRMLLPAITGGQGADFIEEAQRLVKIAEAVANLQHPHECDYTPLPIKTKIVTEHTVNMDDLLFQLREDGDNESIEQLLSRMIHGRAEIILTDDPTVDLLGVKIANILQEDDIGYLYNSVLIVSSVVKDTAM